MPNSSQPLLSVPEARERILAALPQGLASATLPLDQASGRIAAAPLFAPRDLPPFANSAVDGYALAGGNLGPGDRLAARRIGLAAAGHPYDGPVPGPGEAIRILTGAPLPAGCDRVVMQEQVRLVEGGGGVEGAGGVERAGGIAGGAGGGLAIEGPMGPGDHVRPAGSDLAGGDLLLEAGQLLSPPRLALLAAAGLCEVPVFRPVRLALFATGDELREPGETLGAGQIHESNRRLLRALAEAPWVEILDLGILPDQPERLEAGLREAAARADLIVSSGGVSVGDTDHMPGLLRRLGSLDFWKVAVKPGKPLAVGRIGERPYFGLPGNPVSTAVTFLLFVLPALRRLAGLSEVLPPLWTARLAHPLSQHPGRESYLRAAIEPRREGDPWPWVRVLEGQGSHQLSGLAAADCLLRMPADCASLVAGEAVDLLPLPWAGA